MSASTSAGPDSPKAFRRIEAVLAAFFIAIAIACQAWQPFRLGFYCDDWALFVQPRLHAQDFHFLGTWHVDRPGYAIFDKLMLELWDGRAATFHLVKIAIDLTTAAALGWTILVYQKSLGARSFVLAASSAAFWLVAPWSLGYSLWPTAAFTNISVLFLCFSAIALARWVERREYVWLLLTTAAFGASVFFYQSTWLAIFPFALVLAVRDWRDTAARRATVIAFCALGAMQLGSAALAWRDSPKTPNPHLLALFRENLKRVSRLGVDHLGAAGNAWLMSAVLAATAVTVAILWSRGGTARTRALAGLALLLTGIAATSAVYASASYGLANTGMFSRTTQMVDFWIAIGGAVLFAAAPGEHRSAAVRSIGLVLSLIIVGSCALAYVPAARPWIASVDAQRAILAKSQPIAQALQPGDAVLTDVPVQRDGITGFCAPWDLTAAVLVHNAGLRPDLAYTFPRVQIIAPYDFAMSWTPGVFTIAPGWTVPGKRLLLWRWQAGTVSVVDHPVATREELLRLLGTR
jgi:hypothetical protein